MATDWDEQKLVNQYLREIRDFKMLNKASERELLKKLKEGTIQDRQEARNQLICANLRFVVSVSIAYQHLGLTLPELINEGNLGLIEAAGRFNLESEVRFLSYAVWWVRQSIIRAIYEKGRLVRISAEKEAKFKKLNDMLERHIQEKSGAVDVHVLARKVKSSVKDVEMILSMTRKNTSLTDPLEDEESRTLLEIIPDGNGVSPDEDAIISSLRGSIEQALAALTPQEKKITQLYFGLETGTPMNLEMLGRRMGVSKERIRQVKKRAIEKIRQYIMDQKLEFEQVA